ncbi:hypothetical protein ACP70R_025741 [Stipagrostis hirtigluma subsp. patula]
MAMAPPAAANHLGALSRTHPRPAGLKHSRVPPSHSPTNEKRIGDGRSPRLPASARTASAAVPNYDERLNVALLAYPIFEHLRVP